MSGILDRSRRDGKAGPDTAVLPSAPICGVTLVIGLAFQKLYLWMGVIDAVNGMAPPDPARKRTCAGPESGASFGIQAIQLVHGRH
ncbi:hypothetical protein [Marinibacterium sp. SX1]|uniref:hypothetical protein n=1 Tax=Marinibacterium sp. SX1 TaxID=3388424 RepID=UPI003D182ABB